MGLFSSKKVVYVASVAYNMAGPITDRLSVMKSTVSRHVLLGEKKKGLGERIVQTQLHGPTMNQRAWFRWAKTNYDLGRVNGQTSTQQPIDESVVMPLLTVPAGFTAVIEESYFSSADVSLWAEQHILETRPADYDTDWIVDYTVSTSTMLIQYADLSTESVVISGYAQDGVYAVVLYRLTNNAIVADPGTLHLFLYKTGTGQPTVDALYVPGAVQQEFFGAIPLRINNKSIAHPDFDMQFPAVTKAYKKATGEKIDNILVNIEDNENLADIDYATMVFGVELTTQETCGLRYLYEFFKRLVPSQVMTPSMLATWFGGAIPNPMGSAVTLSYRLEPSVSVVRVNGANSFMSHMDMRLNWVTIDENFYTGLGKLDAKPGDLWFVDRPKITVSPKPVMNGDGEINRYIGGFTIPHSRLYWQTSATTYKVLDLYGMVHQNFVYGGKAVELSTSDALSGDDEEGFIVPLHYPTLTSLPLVLSNQLALSSRHLVFNCYKIVKIRWYQRGIFRILIGVILGIVTAFIFPGAVGLLGTALQVGTFLGFSGMTAIIVGAAVNALAAIMLSMLIEKAAIAIFGEELGRLLSSIITFFAAQAISNLAGGFGFTIDWGQLMQIDRLMGLLNSAVDGASGWIQGQMLSIQEDMTKAQNKFKSDWDNLQKEAFDLLGAGGGFIDPLMFTQSQSLFLRRESRDAFLQRTLMTGSDLIDLNLSMIEDFVDLNLTVDVDNI